MLRTLGREINGRLALGCTGKYSLIASSHSKFGRTISITGGDSIYVIIINSTDTSLTHSCDGTAYKRNFSLDSLALANMRRSLIRTVRTANGPMVIILLSKGPFTVS